MPGRGQPWKKGGHIDDTIDTGDIVDGTIKEEDLDSSVTAKLNSAGGHAIQDEGTPLTQQSNMNFTGAGVTATFGAEDTTIVDIPGGGGGGIDRENVADPFTDFYFYDEFFYPTPSTGLNTHYEKVGSFSVPQDVEGGQVQVATTSVVNNVARVNLCGAGNVPIDVTKNFRIVWRTRKTISGDATQAFEIGLYNDGGGGYPGGTFPFAFDVGNSIRFVSTGTGNWFAETDDNITPTSNDTGVIDDATFHVFEIRSNPAGPNIEFLIDNNVVHTATTNLPTGRMAGYATVQTNITNQRNIMIDSFFLYSTR